MLLHVYNIVFITNNTQFSFYFKRGSKYFLTLFEINYFVYSLENLLLFRSIWKQW